jgi:hypothetical protein
MLAILLRLAMLGGLSAVAPLAHAQLLTHHDLSYAISKTIAETAIDSCAAKGYGVSAVVVDRGGEVIIADGRHALRTQSVSAWRRQSRRAKPVSGSTAIGSPRRASISRISRSTAAISGLSSMAASSTAMFHPGITT